MNKHIFISSYSLNQGRARPIRILTAILDSQQNARRLSSEMNDKPLKGDASSPISADDNQTKLVGAC